MYRTEVGTQSRLFWRLAARFLSNAGRDAVLIVTLSACETLRRGRPVGEPVDRIMYRTGVGTQSRLFLRLTARFLSNAGRDTVFMTTLAAFEALRRECLT